MWPGSLGIAGLVAPGLMFFTASVGLMFLHHAVQRPARTGVNSKSS